MSEARERELHMMLAELQRSYRQAAQPIIDELVEIEARKPPKPMIIPLECGEPPAHIQQMIRDVERQVKDICLGSLTQSGE